MSETLFNKGTNELFTKILLKEWIKEYEQNTY